MKQDIQLKLQAYLDGELPPAEAKAMADVIASNAAARDLLTELTNTRAAFASHEADLKVPATREFYWSKIRREIHRQERVASPPATIPILVWLRRLLIPTASVAVILLGLAVLKPELEAGRLGAPEMETSLDDAEGFTYRDHQTGVTLVWMSYPAENEFAQMDGEDTLD